MWEFRSGAAVHRDGGDLLAHQFEDRTAEVAGDALIGCGAAQSVAQKGVGKALAAGGEAVEGGHSSPMQGAP